MGEDFDVLDEKRDGDGILLGTVLVNRLTGKILFYGRYAREEVDEISKRSNPKNSLGKSPSSQAGSMTN